MMGGGKAVETIGKSNGTFVQTIYNQQANEYYIQSMKERYGTAPAKSNYSTNQKKKK